MVTIWLGTHIPRILNQITYPVLDTVVKAKGRSLKTYRANLLVTVIYRGRISYEFVTDNFLIEALEEELIVHGVDVDLKGLYGRGVGSRVYVLAYLVPYGELPSTLMSLGLHCFAVDFDGHIRVHFTIRSGNGPRRVVIREDVVVFVEAALLDP